LCCHTAAHSSAYPIEGCPAIIYGNRKPILRRQSVINIENNHGPVKGVNEPFAIIMVSAKPTKHPSTAVEIDVGRSLERLAVVIVLRCWLEDANSDLPSFNGTLLFRDAKNIRPWFTTIEDSVPRRVLTIFFYWHLMSMQTPNIVLVVVLDVNRVETRQKLCGNAIMKWLSDLVSTKRV
jgi:hypothetical protein